MSDRSLGGIVDENYFSTVNNEQLMSDIYLAFTTKKHPPFLDDIIVEVLMAQGLNEDPEETERVAKAVVVHFLKTREVILGRQYTEQPLQLCEQILNPIGKEAW